MSKSKGEGALVFPGKVGEKMEGKLLRAAYVNMNGVNEECKRKEVHEILIRGNVDVFGAGEMHLKGCGIWDSWIKDGKELWDCMEGGLLWAVIEKGRMCHFGLQMHNGRNEQE